MKRRRKGDSALPVTPGSSLKTLQPQYDSEGRIWVQTGRAEIARERAAADRIERAINVEIEALILGQAKLSNSAAKAAEHLSSYRA